MSAGGSRTDRDREHTERHEGSVGYERVSRTYVPWCICGWMGKTGWSRPLAWEELQQHRRLDARLAHNRPDQREAWDDVCSCEHARAVHSALWCETCRGFKRLHRFQFTWTFFDFVESLVDR